MVDKRRLKRFGGLQFPSVNVKEVLTTALFPLDAGESLFYVSPWEEFWEIGALKNKSKIQ